MRNLVIVTAVILIVILSAFLVYRIVHVDISKNIPPIRMDDASALLHKAEASSSRGDYDAAVKDLGMLIARYPDSAQSELAFFTLASVYEKKGELLKAKYTCRKIIDNFPASANIQRAQERLEELNMKILLSPDVMEGAVSYQVEKGDTLKKIAARHNTTVEILSRVNNIKGVVIQIGKKLKIPVAKFSIVVDKSQNILILKADGEVLKTYTVSTGSADSTPAGTFKITTKVVNPPWYTPGAVIPPGSPKNILGSRWLGISKEGYGIHGTTDPQSIGKNVTAGCVRMRNSDVEELYMIVPEGTEVIIID
jgi:lipoprotein-anchoring transpeptidase ErfK/SrfK